MIPRIPEQRRAARLPGRVTGILLVLSVLIGGLLFPHQLRAAPDVRKGSDVFEKWITWQKVCNDTNLSRMETPSVGQLIKLKERWGPELQEQTAFLGLKALFATDEKNLPDSKALEQTRRNIKQFWHLVDKDMPGFIALLKKRGFLLPDLNQKEKGRGTGLITEKYRSLFEDLLPEMESEAESCTMIAVANRFFEYTFSAAGHEKLGLNAETFPLLRMLYAIMWYHLSGTGWKNWHARALDAIQKEPGEIIYVAGGSDIYWPLQNGLKRMLVIDPVLPTQTKYYAEGWQFLVEPGVGGGIGDRIESAGFVLRRSSFQPRERFQLGPHSILASENHWEILRPCQKNHCLEGKVRLDRRTIQQEDFKAKNTFLISFNELYFITAADEDGWGIDPARFPDSIRFVVKQLRRPIGLRELLALKATQMSDFSYIKLGTSVD